MASTVQHKMPSEEHVNNNRDELPESLNKWTGFLLAWVTGVGARFYEEALTRVGIKPTHLAILTLLESEGPMVQARLSDRLSIFKPAMVGLLNELETLGLVQRRPHPSDQRAFEIHLLEAGEQRIHDAEAVSRAATAQFFASLASEEQQVFHALLVRLATSHSKKSPQT
jgi:DNA-binding MarR family transcriptional regulator